MVHTYTCPTRLVFLSSAFYNFGLIVKSPYNTHSLKKRMHPTSSHEIFCPEFDHRFVSKKKFANFDIFVDHGNEILESYARKQVHFLALFYAVGYEPQPCRQEDLPEDVVFD